ncbi:hypothetical protein, conserved [Eimeria praecox]|uniref:Uncharacterized protein n=1 Tax=Eimeria praecox TaxID=51316 RepID=U6G4X3_9EIME|nr:hypothetical protein, conserved [Eimeria praecox]
MQPTRCSGCGAPLQTEEESAVGFVPKHKYDEYSGGRVKRLPKPRGQVVESVPDGVEVLQQTSPKFRVHTSLLTCQRCYRMQHYRSIDSSWERSAVAAAGCLPALSASSVITQLTRVMPNNSIVLKIVDICDLELSVVPELFAACREKGLRALWIVNRIDCLPKNTDLNKLVASLLFFVDTHTT